MVESSAMLVLVSLLDSLGLLLRSLVFQRKRVSTKGMPDKCEEKGQ